MCTNYAPVQRQVLLQVFGVEPPAMDYPAETWPDYAAPLIVADSAGIRHALVGTFGMVPKLRIRPGVDKFDTMNARAETVGEKRSFSGAWKQGNLCLLPATAFFEPNYEAGPKSVRWRIWIKDEPAFAIAGLWRAWPGAESEVFSFTMLTINAEHHTLLSRFHRPGKEKRGVVVLPRAEWDDWLTCRDPERARTFLRLHPADDMAAAPAPLPARAKATG